MRARIACLTAILALARVASAQPDDAQPPSEATPAPSVPEPIPVQTTAPVQAPPPAQSWSDPALEESTADSMQIHGWVGQGAMVSTGNNYIARSKRGSFELFDAGINVTKELASNMRAGVQVFAQNVGPIGNYVPIIDWAYVDYRARPWFGLRIGRFKMPLGLYSDQLDADMSRATVLMPQSVYDLHYRDILAAISGLDVYGAIPLGRTRTLDYDAYIGTFHIQPRGGDFDVETVLGSRVVWNTPLQCLRATGHFQYGNMHEKSPLDAMTIEGVKMGGLAPPDWDGSLTINYDNWRLMGGGLECETEKLTFTTEATLWKSELTFAPMLQPTSKFHQFRGYAQVVYRATDRVSGSVYLSALLDRTGGVDSSDPAHHQYDLAGSIRYDATPDLLFKAEAHAMDGYTATEKAFNTGTQRAARWGMFLLKTTISF